MRSLRLVLAAAVTAGLAVTLPARAAGPVYEVATVTGSTGESLRVEVLRDPSRPRQPVILELSPYNDVTSERVADTAAGRRYVSQGYAVAVADVLGTRGSTGCWDYGGKAEQQAGVDVVRWLARQPWSNGRVGMTGVSYDGTTATMVAATGVPELKAIAPVAAISRWYGYAYSDGVRYAGNSRVPTDQGADTPVVFDALDGRTPLLSPDDPSLAANTTSAAQECGVVEHTRQGYSSSPDYGPFWLERDYLKDASRFRAAVFLAHGWQDYNVKQDESLRLFEALPVDDPRTVRVEGVPFKRLWLTQGSHSAVREADYVEALDRFWAATLKSPGTDPRIPVVTTRGSDGRVRTEASWPPPGTSVQRLWLGRSFVRHPGVPGAVPNPAGASREDGVLSVTPRKDGGGWTHVDTGTVSEEVTLVDPLNTRGHGYYSLFQQSPVLTRSVRLAGSAVLDAWVNASTPGQHLTPLLVDVAPDGTLSLVERGFLDLDYRDGLASAKPTSGWQHARVRLLPQDHVFAAGHRIGLLLQASNTVWAVPGAAGALSYAMGPVSGVTKQGTWLELPVVGADLARAFGAAT